MQPNGGEGATIDHECSRGAPNFVEQGWGAGHPNSAKLPQIWFEEATAHDGRACVVSGSLVPDCLAIQRPPTRGRDPNLIRSRKGCRKQRRLPVPKRYLSVVEEHELGIVSERTSDLVEPFGMKKIVVVEEPNDGTPGGADAEPRPSYPALFRSRHALSTALPHAVIATLV